jgi:hypothetical protein
MRGKTRKRLKKLSKSVGADIEKVKRVYKIGLYQLDRDDFIRCLNQFRNYTAMGEVFGVSRQRVCAVAKLLGVKALNR